MTPEVWQKLLKHVENTCSPDAKTLMEMTVTLRHKVKPTEIAKELPLVISWFNLLVKVHTETGLVCLLEAIEHVDPQMKKRACTFYRSSIPLRPIFQRSILFLLKELHGSIGKLTQTIDTVLPEYDKACTVTKNSPTLPVYRQMMSTLADWLSLVGKLPTIAESKEKKPCPTDCKTCTATDCCPRNAIDVAPYLAGGAVVGMMVAGALL